MGRNCAGPCSLRGSLLHIRLAVEQAQAERIGHGVDIMYENHLTALKRDGRQSVMWKSADKQ